MTQQVQDPTPTEGQTPLAEAGGDDASSNGHERKDGRVVAIAGPVVDVEFPSDALPEINTALRMTLELEGAKETITAEVAQTFVAVLPRHLALAIRDRLAEAVSEVLVK